MWLIVGDTHGLKSFDSRKIYPEHLKSMGVPVDDVEGIIICGDFGGIWKGNISEVNTLRSILDVLPYKICFVDGNHENHVAISKFPVRQWKGGKIHVITDNVYHLMRGQVYTIDGKKIFTMGGATSIDKDWRTPNISWWEQEIPTKRQWQIAKNNLDKVNWKVDYVLTHCCPTEFMSEFVDSRYKTADEVSDGLQVIYNLLEYKKWFCGHYHTDKDIDNNISCLYFRVIGINFKTNKEIIY